MPVTLEQIEEVLGFKFQPHQVKAIQCMDPRQAYWWGRKGGKTTKAAARYALRLCNDSVPGVGYDGGIGIVSAGEKQAKAILEVTRFILHGLGWQFDKDRQNMSEENKIAYARSFELQMPNRNRLLAMAVGKTNPGISMRPYSLHELNYDEADHQPEEVFASTAPCIIRYKGIRVMDSTQNIAGDEDTFFMKAVLGKMSGWTSSIIPTRLCGTITADEILQMKREMTPEEYAREIECKLVAQTNRVFPKVLVRRCVDSNNTVIGPLFKENTYVGIDFARFGADDNVLAFAHWDGKRVFVHAKMYPGRGTRTTEITRLVLALCKKYPTIKKIVTDDNGVGAGPTDALVDALGTRKVEGISNQRRVEDMDIPGITKRYIKEDMYTNLLRMMEAGKIVFARQQNMLNSILGMKYTYTKHKELRIDGNYSHYAEAVVRACFPVMSKRAKRHIDWRVISEKKDSNIWDDNKTAWVHV